jgi:hypothetical protein
VNVILHLAPKRFRDWGRGSNYSAVLRYECRREKARSCRHGQMTSIHDESCEGRYLIDATPSDSESQEVKYGQYEVRNTSG